MTDISLGVDDVEDDNDDFPLPAFAPPLVPLLLFDLFFLAMVADCRLPSNGSSKQYGQYRAYLDDQRLKTTQDVFKNGLSKSTKTRDCFR